MQRGRSLRRVLATLRHGRAIPALGMLAVLGLVLVAGAAWAGAVFSAGQGERAPSQSAPRADQAGQYFIYMETLTADRPSVYGYIAPRGCQLTGAFKRGERMVFRFQVLDIQTGKMLTPNEAAGVKVRLPFVGDMDAEYKQRGEGSIPDAPWTWDYCWDVPPDYPLGTLDYSVVVSSKDGRSGVWKPPALVDPSRGIDSRPQVME
ncbi:MAG: hypothetical protein HY331_13025 [Chloroflexi bacterium]|nr:hypothetical protein [Chloroflexota bacterium]